MLTYCTRTLDVNKTKNLVFTVNVKYLKKPSACTYTVRDLCI